MGNLEGESSAEIEAPIEQVWELVADVERAPDWQGGLKSLTAIERDGEGRATLCESENDAKVRTIKSTVRFTYEPPTRPALGAGEGRAEVGRRPWTLEDLGDGRTRATYRDRRRLRLHAGPGDPRPARRRAARAARGSPRRRAEAAIEST